MRVKPKKKSKKEKNIETNRSENKNILENKEKENLNKELDIIINDKNSDLSNEFLIKFR